MNNNFDEWVHAKRIRDAIGMYHFAKARGISSLALAALRQALFLKVLEKHTKEKKNMMISLRIRGGDPYYLNVDLIESIIEREGNTSEIRLTNGKIYTSIESPEQLANRVTRAQMSSELAKPKEGIYANSLR